MTAATIDHTRADVRGRGTGTGTGTTPTRAPRPHRFLWWVLEALAAASWCSPVGNPAAGLAVTGGLVDPPYAGDEP